MIMWLLQLTPMGHPTLTMGHGLNLFVGMQWAPLPCLLCCAGTPGSRNKVRQLVR